MRSKEGVIWCKAISYPNGFIIIFRDSLVNEILIDLKEYEGGETYNHICLLPEEVQLLRRLKKGEES